LRHAKGALELVDVDILARSRTADVRKVEHERHFLIVETPALAMVRIAVPRAKRTRVAAMQFAFEVMPGVVLMHVQDTRVRPEPHVRVAPFPMVYRVDHDPVRGMLN